MNRRLSTRFRALIKAYAHEDSEAERKKIDQSLWKEFGIKETVFVLDMSGFSLLSQKYGIVHYLSMVRRMQETAEPIIRKNKGTVVKFEADNCYAVFPRPDQAVKAAIALEAGNVFTPDELDIRVSIGIDYGKLLSIDGKDLFGNAVNRACKLGEDLAGPGEILITVEAMHRIAPGKRPKARLLTLAISGIELDAYSIDFRQITVSATPGQH